VTAPIDSPSTPRRDFDVTELDPGGLCESTIAVRSISMPWLWDDQDSVKPSRSPAGPPLRAPRSEGPRGGHRTTKGLVAKKREALPERQRMHLVSAGEVLPLRRWRWSEQRTIQDPRQNDRSLRGTAAARQRASASTEWQETATASGCGRSLHTTPASTQDQNA